MVTLPALGCNKETMTDAWQDIKGPDDSAILLIADHASNHVPEDIDLGVDADVLERHVALDIGVEPLGRALCASLECPGILGGVSRLVVDFNREEDTPHIIPIASDGHAIAGNMLSHDARAERIDRFWRPYHQRIADQIATQAPKLIISLHSFTPQLETQPDVARPWQIGILYNQDDRAARIAIPLLEQAGVIVGDQLPYSGKLLNATMNSHAEANGIAYLGIEMRQDLIGDAVGVAHWAAVLTPIISSCMRRVTQL
jgi:predicted N-formylglutamate amidohydrolase